jgi:hypothetical protein
MSTAGEAELGEIYEEINAMEKKELTSRKFTQYESRFQIFILLALFALFFETIIPVRKRVYVKSG